jgi:hypothetical protein
MAVKTRAELIAQNTATFGNGKNTRGDDEKAFNLNHLDSFLNKKGDTLENNGFVAVQDGSKLKQGTNGGIALECIVGYDFQWKEGIAYYRPTGGGIVYAMSAVDQIPNTGFDSTLFYQVGSRFVNLVTNVQYICTDASVGAATWSVVASGGGLTSVGLSMPPAFTVALPNPLTSNGTLTVTGAGTVAQYVRGDGSLANFPTSSGGGSSINYYLNGSVTPSPNVVGYKQMSRVANTGAAANFTRTNTAGFQLMAEFVTDGGDPGLLNIPAGAWDFNFYFRSSDNAADPQFYVELLKYDGTNFTSIATGIATPETITNGTTIDLYTTAITIPSSTVLTVTDRLVIRVYVDTDGNRTVTFYTQDSRLAEVFTTFTTGITALNGLTAQVQSFATPGTSGTAPAWNSTTATHTLNIPLASAAGVTAGLISKTDYDSFSGKQSALFGTGYVKFSVTTPSYLSPTQVTADLNLFTSLLQGLVPASGGGVSNFLRADGTWAAPSGSGGMSIGGAITSATAGSVLFAGTSGVLAQANSTFFWDNTNARLGIGFGTTISARLALGAGTATVPHFTLTPSTADFTGTTDGMLTYQNISGTRNLVLYKGTIATPILTAAINSSLTGSAAAAALNVDAAGNITRGGEIQSLGIISQITTVTITGTGATSTLSGTLNGSATLPALFFGVGKVITGKMSGTLATGGNAGTLAFRVRLGGVTICDSTGITYTISTAAEPITVEYTILCTAIGAAGTAAFRCDMRILSGGTLLVNRTVLISSTTTSSGIATTGTLVIDLDANLSAAGNTLTVLQNQLVNSN